MAEDTPKTLKLSPMALFRYQIVSFVLALCLDGRPKTGAVRQVADLVHPSPRGPRTVSARSPPVLTPTSRPNRVASSRA